jgi:hypothetical protein
MTEQDKAVFRKNIQLKKSFIQLGLDPAPVMEFMPYNLDIENRRLEHLLRFTLKYQECLDRKTMELIGELWPPVFPAVSPASDWIRFEKWLAGEDLTQTLYDKISRKINLPDPKQITIDELDLALKKLYKVLHKLGIGVSLVFDLPPLVEYHLIIDILKSDTDSYFEFGCTIDGCSGYCPGCMQRPWCDSGLENKWPEDIERGKMHLPPELRDFVSASPHSLEMLNDAEEFEISNSNSDFPYNLDALPFYSPLDYPDVERPELDSPLNFN